MAKANSMFMLSFVPQGSLYMKSEANDQDTYSHN